MNGASKVLIVEDARSLSKLFKREIEKRVDVPIVCAATFGEAEEILRDGEDNFFLSLLDLTLPDAQNGEIVDLANTHDVPSVVISGNMDEELRDALFDKGVIDFVSKDSWESLEYMVTLVERVHTNQKIKVLVVDDSRTARSQISTLLIRLGFVVLEAASGEEALSLLAGNPDVQMVLTDFLMPGMDGVELVRHIRRNRSQQDLIVVGLSAYDNKVLSARFIRHGANDFLTKPFSNEELTCRIFQNLQLLEYMRRLHKAATTDFLTGLYNRRFFFEFAGKTMAQLKRSAGTCAFALFDIDHFKRVNDTFGHDTGDAVLKHVAEILNSRFRESDAVARLGGEEFCVLAVGIDPSCAPRIFDEVRAKIEASPITVNGKEISVTVSVGLSCTPGVSVDDTLRQVDAQLYVAKERGRNRVVGK